MSDEEGDRTPEEEPTLPGAAPEPRREPDDTSAWPPPGEQAGRSPDDDVDATTETGPTAETGSERTQVTPPAAWAGRAQVRPPAMPADQGGSTQEWYGPQWEEPPRRDRRWWTPVLVGLVALLMVAALGVGIWLIAHTLSVEDPSVVPPGSPSATGDPSTPERARPSREPAVPPSPPEPPPRTPPPSPPSPPSPTQASPTAPPTEPPTAPATGPTRGG